MLDCGPDPLPLVTLLDDELLPETPLDDGPSIDGSSDVEGWLLLELWYDELDDQYEDELPDELPEELPEELEPQLQAQQPA